MQGKAACSPRPDPPGTKSEDQRSAEGNRSQQTENAAGGGKQRALQQENAPQYPAGEAHSLEGADFPHTLLHAEPEKQCREKNGRSDQKKTEVEEIFSKIGRSPRGVTRPL